MPRHLRLGFTRPTPFLTTHEPNAPIPSASLCPGAISVLTATAFAGIGTRFPSKKKVVADPVTGIPLTFLPSTEAGDSKIYQTLHKWTSDGKWGVFRSNRVRGQAMAVNEKAGDILQVSAGTAEHPSGLGIVNLRTREMRIVSQMSEGNPGRSDWHVNGSPDAAGLSPTISIPPLADRSPHR